VRAESPLDVHDLLGVQAQLLDAIDSHLARGQRFTPIAHSGVLRDVCPTDPAYTLVLVPPVVEVDGLPREEDRPRQVMRRTTCQDY